MKKLELNQHIYFIGEILPMKVMARNDRFAICVRELNPDADNNLLEFEVKRGAYSSKQSAWNALKGEMCYSIVDFKEMIKGPHNLVFNLTDFKDIESINDLLEDLEMGNVEISHRHRAELQIDYELSGLT